MPDYRVLPQPGSISIGAAIRAGRRDVDGKAWLIFIGAVLAAVVAVCYGMSAWWIAGGFLAGVAGAILHMQLARPKWRIWAYSGVADIHQFQRCAELEGLLPKQSPTQHFGIMDSIQQHQLQQLLLRFDHDGPFIDDPDILQVSAIRASLLSLRFRAKPLISVSRTGITTWNLGFVPWENIWDEHVAIKSFVRSRVGYNSGSGSHRMYLCFTCPELMFELPLSDLNISPSELDQILYIHRGRYEQDKAGREKVIPLKSPEADRDL